MLTKVFTYGTLKRGLHNNHIIDESLVENISEAKLEGYVLYYVSGGGFPLIVPEEGKVVHGELFEFKTQDWEQQLERLDALEGYNGKHNDSYNLYNRIKVNVIVDGEEIECWVYEFNYKHNLRLIGERIEDGNFLGPRQNRFSF